MQSPITYPARPINGGPFDKALPKFGEWHYSPKYNGWRVMVHIPSGKMWNRLNQPLTIAAEFDAAVSQLRDSLNGDARFAWADCEGLDRRHSLGRGSLILLDLVPQPVFASATLSTDRKSVV